MDTQSCKAYLASLEAFAIDKDSKVSMENTEVIFNPKNNYLSTSPVHCRIPKSNLKKTKLDHLTHVTLALSKKKLVKEALWVPLVRLVRLVM